MDLARRPFLLSPFYSTIANRHPLPVSAFNSSVSLEIKLRSEDIKMLDYMSHRDFPKIRFLEITE